MHTAPHRLRRGRVQVDAPPVYTSTYVYGIGVDMDMDMNMWKGHISTNMSMSSNCTETTLLTTWRTHLSDGQTVQLDEVWY